MNPLLVNTASDGSSLVLGEDDSGLVFEQKPDGAFESAGGEIAVLWPVVDRRPHVAFAGEAAHGVDRVQLQLPSDEHTCPVRDVRGRRVWLSFAVPFGADGLGEGDVVTATWLAGDRVVKQRQTPPLTSTWTGFAPIADT